MLVAAVAFAALALLIVSTRRGTRGTAFDLAVALTALVGAAIAPQAAVVVFLALIYVELRRQRVAPPQR